MPDWQSTFDPTLPVLESAFRGTVMFRNLNRRVMRRELMTDEELLSRLRLHGIQDVSAVERANIEPNGMISVVGRNRAGMDPAG